MVSSSSSLATKITPEPVVFKVFKFQGVPLKYFFQDVHSEIQDTKMGHIDWNAFLVLYNKPNERFPMVSTLNILRLVNVASHPISIQSSELIMVLANNYVLE